MKTKLIRRLPKRAWAALAALVACAAQGQTLPQNPPQPGGLPEPAEAPQSLVFRVGQRIEYDSNVLRLAPGVAVPAQFGTSSRADLYGVTTLGVKFDQQYSLQRLALDIHAQNYRYRDFSVLDFTALNYTAAWRFGLTPRLQGTLTADQRELLDNTVDSVSPSEVNRRIERATALEAEYELGSAWRLLGGVYRRSLDNTLAQTYEADTTVTGGELGLRHVWMSDSALAYRYKRGQGDYSGRPAGQDLPAEFKDREHEFSLDWRPFPGTTLLAKLAHVHRTHDTFAGRDFSGLRGQLSANWPLTGKTRLEAGIVRELGSYQTDTASYYEGERLYISPVWKPTEKTAVRLRLDQGVRRYKQPRLNFPDSGRRDTTSLASLSVEWEVIRPLKLAVTVQQDKRSSNTPGVDYTSNLLGVSALFSF